MKNQFRYKLFIIIMCFVISDLPAQDSLLVVYNQSTNTEDRLQALDKILSTYIYSNTNLADSFVNISLDIVKDLNNDSLIVRYLKAKASIKLAKAEYDSVFFYVHQSQGILKTYDNPELKSSVLHVEALTHYYQGNYDKSLELNFESLDIRQSMQREDLQLRSFTNIAISYERMDDFEKALKYNKSALALVPDDDKYYKAVLGNNITGVLIRQSKYKEALEMSIEANKSAKSIDNSLLILDTNLGIAKSHYGLKQFNQALPFAEDAVSLSDELNNKARMLTSFNILGGIHLKLKRYQNAIKYCQQALDISIRNDIQENRINIYQTLSAINREIYNYQKTTEYQDSIISMKDAFHKIEKTKIAEELNVKYQTLQKDNKIKETQLAFVKQGNQQNILLGGLMFLALLASSIFVFMKNRLTTNKKLAIQESKLQRQQIDKLEKEKKILSMSRMLEGQESERKRIAQDLHDGLGGLLATIKIKFGIIQKELAALESLNVYQQTSSMIDDACIEVRKIAHNMMPDSLTKLGLVEAVRDIAEYTSDINIKVINLGLHKLSETQEIMLYRVIQEFLNNTRKHAMATELIIQFSSDDLNSIIYLEDNGQGFDMSAGNNSRGLGLKSMESRINFLGGTCELDSVIGVGTTLQIHLPKS